MCGGGLGVVPPAAGRQTVKPPFLRPPHRDWLRPLSSLMAVIQQAVCSVFLDISVSYLNFLRLLSWQNRQTRLWFCLPDGPANCTWGKQSLWGKKNMQIHTFVNENILCAQVQVVLVEPLYKNTITLPNSTLIPHDRCDMVIFYGFCHVF